jgi:hypothetical protein
MRRLLAVSAVLVFSFAALLGARRPRRRRIRRWGPGSRRPNSGEHATLLTNRGLGARKAKLVWTFRGVGWTA